HRYEGGGENHGRPEELHGAVPDAKAGPGHDALERLLAAQWHQFIPRDLQQFTERHDAIAARLEVIDDPRQRLEGLRAIAPGIMQQHDVAFRAQFLDPLQDDVRPWLRPVLRIDFFQYDSIAELLLGQPQWREFRNVSRRGIRVVGRA